MAAAMSGGPAWLPPAASDMAVRVDHLFYGMVVLTGLVALVVLALMIFFCVRYRRGSKADRSHPPVTQRALELGWIFTPLAIFLGVFVWAASLYASFYRPDPAAATVFVVGRQWMWKVEHADGRREIDELHLPLGQPVRLVLSTEDVIHSFFLPAFRIKQDAVPGRYTSIRFTPTRPGEYRLHCAEYCGTDHARMGGRVYVLPPAQFARWLASGDQATGMAARGFELFRRKGCSGCHAAQSSVHAPDLDRIFGRTVHLADGRSLVADEAYLRDSMLLPKKDVVAGYEPIMPSFQGQLDEGEIAALVQYLKEGSP
jgi:cytochrome c oxidase subunit 2